MIKPPFLSEPPVVKLAGIIEDPYNLVVATARTCYSSKGIVTRDDVTKDEKTLALRDKIASSTLAAGHLTTRQHATFVFALDRVSRQFIWSFLHSHPYYNSEQVSQRYVKVARGHYTVPAMPERAAKKFTRTVDLQMDRYNQLIELLMPDIRRRFFTLFPARRTKEEDHIGSLKKRAYEVARYLLPVATHAYLYHTVSALTLLRYRRLCRLFDAPEEQRYVVDRMVEEILRFDPDFEKELRDPLPLDQTPEFEFLSQRQKVSDPKAFTVEFDRSLEGHSSRLVDYKVNAEPIMAQAVRNTLGVTRDRLTDDEAIALVMHPAQNRYFGDTLNVTTLAKLPRVLFHPHYTFRKKISHTADSQDQRHRMTPASRPILKTHYSGDPDYILPMLVQENEGAREVYEETMQEVFGAINDLLGDGVEPESALYLLPNAFPIRFEESGDLLNLHHKWKARSCYTAQEEIFFATIDELKQVKEVHPRLAAHILAPCYLRRHAGQTPYCPEGDHYCGVPVWKLAINDYQRTL